MDEHDRFLVNVKNLIGLDTTFTVDDYAYCAGGVIFKNGNKESFIPYSNIELMEVEDLYEKKFDSKQDTGSLNRLL